MSINSAYALGALREIERKEAERNAERQKILLKGAESELSPIRLPFFIQIPPVPPAARSLPPHKAR